MTTRATPSELSQNDHRRVIGLLGLFMPWLIYVLAGLRPTPGLDHSWKWLESVSAYFYTGGVEVFCGVLVALALFLATYRGYKDVAVDRWVGRIAGLAAIGVALFPTDAPPPLLAPTWWSLWTGRLHYACAVTLFLSFIVFSIWLFRKSAVPTRAARPPDKNLRDDICLACGIVMIAAVLWAGIAGLRERPIVVPEVIAIEAFAISWLTKASSR